MARAHERDRARLDEPSARSRRAAGRQSRGGWPGSSRLTGHGIQPILWVCHADGGRRRLRMDADKASSARDRQRAPKETSTKREVIYEPGNQATPGIRGRACASPGSRPARATRSAPHASDPSRGRWKDAGRCDGSVPHGPGRHLAPGRTCELRRLRGLDAQTICCRARRTAGPGCDVCRQADHPRRRPRRSIGSNTGQQATASDAPRYAPPVISDRLHDDGDGVSLVSYPDTSRPYICRTYHDLTRR
jgi:hypothetical protein